MALIKPTFNSLEDLFWDQVKDIYDAEQRLTDALPKMADAANDPALKTAFREHLDAAVRPVLYPPAHALAGRGLDGEPAEADTLHAAGDGELARDDHGDHQRVDGELYPAT
jgi:hypothetical protein